VKEVFVIEALTVSIL